MVDLAAALKRGWQLHQEGQYADAEAVYRQAILSNPQHPLARYCLGRLAFDAGRYESAIEHLSEAIRFDRSQAVFHGDLGQAYQSLGRWSDAAASYRAALTLDASHAATHVNLGNVLLQSGEPQQALASYQQALQCDPGLADAHSCLGVVFEQLGHVSSAIDSYRRAVALRPDYALAHFNLGTALKQDQQFEPALISLQRAIELNPNLADAHNNLGAVYEKLVQMEEAQRSFERAIQLAPDRGEFRANLGSVLRDREQPEAAIASYDEHLKRFPDDPDSRCGRGLALISLGRVREGWAEHEYRIQSKQFDSTLNLPQPLWDGSPLNGRTLLIHAEQGLGDTLQFIRYAKMAEQLGENIVLAVQPALLPLLKCSGFKNLISNELPLPDFDVQAPLMSMPHIFKTDLETIPADIPYLSVEPERIKKWRQRLSQFDGLKVGIFWQGNPRHYRDRVRSFSLRCFAPLARASNVQLISLQRAASEQIAEVAHEFQVHVLEGLDAEGGAFMDTAAVLANLDLAVVCDTAVGHLAGALGVPVWMAISVGPDWRWMFNREDTPWYPSMRLFRQTKPRQWSDVFERMAAELAQFRPMSTAPHPQ